MRVRNLLFRNFLAKIFSLAFAVVLWVVVIGEKQAQIQLDIPLEVVNIPTGTVLVSDIPSSISVQVQGPRTVIRTLPARGIRKSISLEGMSVGRTTIRILPDSIPLPRGIEVVQVSPSSLNVRLEPFLEVALPVSPQIVGNPPRGFRIDKIAAEPAEVVLKGGEGELTDLSEVETHPVNVSQATTDVEERVGLELQGLHLVGVSPSTVRVRVTMNPILIERTLEDVPVRVAPSPMRVTVDPDKIRVVVKGPVDVVDGIQSMDIGAEVKVEGLEPGSHWSSVNVAVPEGIRVTSVEPSKLQITVERPTDQEQE